MLLIKLRLQKSYLSIGGEDIKRSGKFYRRNEREVMESLGFEPTPNSGSGWIVKEDGQNEDAICQLKSTDANSIRVCQKDIEVLEYNALVSHKIPVFAIQFLKTNEVFLLVRPENLEEVSKVIKGESLRESHTDFLGLDMGQLEVERGISEKDLNQKGYRKQVIKSSSKGREDFTKEYEERYRKKSKSAK